ncbi:alkanesulfonate monooxygenase SsuD/methylene tetrahydromethanopterin reductase-like flavin-dependent oxidoreductase (luciferase family) [Rhodoligotrophos appendicifer]|uniref:LLM class flavin-dependent oxidoreductase n=1 Tax=Rhodoligotrophos appendicifer TaxID=987056 RepID=UPI001184F2A4|nr:LLM class flavin-dependent oxidoreductase [Rhodoligotrophos appendicifer]
MDFGYYLPCYWPDISVPMRHMYREMVREAQYAEELGYHSLTIPEHHFTNALVHPDALLSAVHVAAQTKYIPIVTATTVLPFHNIPQLAGQIAQADCLTGGRIQIGVGRGAYRYEFARLQVPFEEARERFDDSLELLIALLGGEDVSWDSKFYKLGPTTITPRPVQDPHPRIWFAATTPGAIEYAAGRSFSVMTTPLRSSFDHVVAQANAFKVGRGKVQSHDFHQDFSMLIMLFVTESQQETDDMIRHALNRHRRFLNVFGGEGEVVRGAITPYESDLTEAEIGKNLIIGSVEECAERLEDYARLGIGQLQLNMNFGAPHARVMRSLELFATRVGPRFAKRAAIPSP